MNDDFEGVGEASVQNLGVSPDVDLVPGNPELKSHRIALIRLMRMHAQAMRAAPLTPQAERRLLDRWVQSRRHGTGFTVVFAEAAEDEIIGFALYYRGFNSFLARPTVYWEDGFIVEQYRNRGIGERFWRTIERVARRAGCCHVVFSVQDWNEPVIRFHHRHGAARVEGRSMYKIPIVTDP